MFQGLYPFLLFLSFTSILDPIWTPIGLQSLSTRAQTPNTPATFLPWEVDGGAPMFPGFSICDLVGLPNWWSNPGLWDLDFREGWDADLGWRLKGLDRFWRF